MNQTVEKLRKTVLPLLAAFLWGVAFVAQKTNTMGAFAFNSSRSAVAFLFLLPVILVFTRDPKHLLSAETKQGTKTLWLGGICCGGILTLSTSLQQLGMNAGTEAGKASFLTAMYVVLVPALGLFFKKKVPVHIWLSVAFALAGLYFLCVKVGFSVAPSDLIVASCAFVFSVHILAVDYFSARCNCLKLSCIQFLTMTVLSGILTLLFDEFSLASVGENLSAVLYLGICSSGIAYTLQIVSQRGANPTVLSLLLSCESVFGVLAGALVLQEVLTPREYVGCALMMLAVVLSQLPVDRWLAAKLQKRKKHADSAVISPAGETPDESTETIPERKQR